MTPAAASIALASTSPLFGHSIGKTEAIAILGVTLTQFRRLRGNHQFPAATSDDGYENLVFESSHVAAFATNFTAAKANGWQPTDAALPIIDVNGMAAGTPGPAYVPQLSEPIFEP